MPVVEGKIAADGYESQHWVPVMFVWDESRQAAQSAEHPGPGTHTTLRRIVFADINHVDPARADYTKFAYHEGARIIRTVQDRICEITYTGTPPSQDEGETLCDMLIELHQLLYSVTLFTFRKDDILVEDDSYDHDEVYSDGRPVVSRVQLPVDLTDEPIPAEAYRGDIGEEIPLGGVIDVWRPGEAEHPLTGEEAAEATRLDASSWLWKAAADLRTRGQIAWLRDDNGHIVKRPGTYGRACAVSAITAAGRAECERGDQELAADGAAGHTRAELATMIDHPQESDQEGDEND
jgi:hypothetical protein